VLQNQNYLKYLQCSICFVIFLADVMPRPVDGSRAQESVPLWSDSAIPRVTVPRPAAFSVKAPSFNGCVFMR